MISCHLSMNLRRCLSYNHIWISSWRTLELKTDGWSSNSLIFSNFHHACSKKRSYPYYAFRFFHARHVVPSQPDRCRKAIHMTCGARSAITRATDLFKFHRRKWHSVAMRRTVLHAIRVAVEQHHQTMFTMVTITSSTAAFSSWHCSPPAGQPNKCYTNATQMP